ncbi:hypothetical protein QL285_034438 [Trifolium repens]|nr:hypothetical protein QL285_034438 [Trifolium repens]
MVLVLRTTYCSGVGTSFSGYYRSFHLMLCHFPPLVLLFLPTSSSHFSMLRRSGVVRIRLRRRFSCPSAWFSGLVFGSCCVGPISGFGCFGLGGGVGGAAALFRLRCGCVTVGGGVVRCWWCC